MVIFTNFSYAIICLSKIYKYHVGICIIFLLPFQRIANAA